MLNPPHEALQLAGTGVGVSVGVGVVVGICAYVGDGPLVLVGASVFVGRGVLVGLFGGLVGLGGLVGMTQTPLTQTVLAGQYMGYNGSPPQFIPCALCLISAT